MVSAGVGVGLVPRSALVDHDGNGRSDVVAIDLDEPWAKRNLQVCIRNDDNVTPFARHLIDRLTAESGC